ncbi:unnamed protein product [Gordionus sp. m RMFG-2023]
MSMAVSILNSSILITKPHAPTYHSMNSHFRHRRQSRNRNEVIPARLLLEFLADVKISIVERLLGEEPPNQETSNQLRTEYGNVESKLNRIFSPPQDFGNTRNTENLDNSFNSRNTERRLHAEIHQRNRETGHRRRPIHVSPESRRNPPFPPPENPGINQNFNFRNEHRKSHPGIRRRIEEPTHNQIRTTHGNLENKRNNLLSSPENLDNLRNHFNRERRPHHKIPPKNHEPSPPYRPDDNRQPFSLDTTSGNLLDIKKLLKGLSINDLLKLIRDYSSKVYQSKIGDTQNNNIKKLTKEDVIRQSCVDVDWSKKFDQKSIDNLNSIDYPTIKNSLLYFYKIAHHFIEDTLYYLSLKRGKGKDSFQTQDVILDISFMRKLLAEYENEQRFNSHNPLNRAIWEYLLHLDDMIEYKRSSCNYEFSDGQSRFPSKFEGGTSQPKNVLHHIQIRDHDNDNKYHTIAPRNHFQEAINSLHRLSRSIECIISIIEKCYEKYFQSKANDINNPRGYNLLISIKQNNEYLLTSFEYITTLINNHRCNREGKRFHSLHDPHKKEHYHHQSRQQGLLTRDETIFYEQLKTMLTVVKRIQISLNENGHSIESTCHDYFQHIGRQLPHKERNKLQIDDNYHDEAHQVINAINDILHLEKDKGSQKYGQLTHLLNQPISTLLDDKSKSSRNRYSDIPRERVRDAKSEVKDKDIKIKIIGIPLLRKIRFKERRHHEKNIRQEIKLVVKTPMPKHIKRIVEAPKPKHVKNIVEAPKPKHIKRIVEAPKLKHIKHIVEAPKPIRPIITKIRPQKKKVSYSRPKQQDFPSKLYYPMNYYHDNFDEWFDYFPIGLKKRDLRGLNNQTFSPQTFQRRMPDDPRSAGFAQTLISIYNEIPKSIKYNASRQVN